MLHWIYTALLLLCYSAEHVAVSFKYCVFGFRLGSTCKHIATVLFKVNYAWQNCPTAAHSKPCTSTENEWMANTNTQDNGTNETAWHGSCQTTLCSKETLCTKEPSGKETILCKSKQQQHFWAANTEWLHSCTVTRNSILQLFSLHYWMQNQAIIYLTSAYGARPVLVSRTLRSARGIRRPRTTVPVHAVL